jgi:hypothetical protein
MKPLATSLLAAVILFGATACWAADAPSGDSASTTAQTPSPLPASPVERTLGGNLPKIVEKGRYLVVADVYVPSGKTVTFEPGTVLLFKNFTGMHVEGRLVAEGTAEYPIVFTSELDQAYRPGAALHANPYDWNGIYLHESGIGSSFARCSILFSVYGISSLTKYIKIDNVVFVNNGRSDLTIEGKGVSVTPAKPFSYVLSINDARRDGVPVRILMDPYAKKRSTLRYGGLSLFVGGATLGLWSGIQASRDQQRMNAFSDTAVVSQASNLVANRSADWAQAKQNRDRDVGLSIGGFSLAVLGGCGFGFSFIF